MAERREFEFSPEVLGLFVLIQQEILEDECAQKKSTIQGSSRKASLLLNSL